MTHRILIGLTILALIALPALATDQVNISGSTLFGPFFSALRARTIGLECHGQRHLRLLHFLPLRGTSWPPRVPPPGSGWSPAAASGRQRAEGTVRQLLQQPARQRDAQRLRVRQSHRQEVPTTTTLVGRCHRADGPRQRQEPRRRAHHPDSTFARPLLARCPPPGSSNRNRGRRHPAVGNSRPLAAGYGLGNSYATASWATGPGSVTNKLTVLSSASRSSGGSSWRTWSEEVSSPGALLDRSA